MEIVMNKLSKLEWLVSNCFFVRDGQIIMGSKFQRSAKKIEHLTILLLTFSTFGKIWKNMK